MSYCLWSKSGCFTILKAWCHPKLVILEFLKMGPKCWKFQSVAKNKKGTALRVFLSSSFSAGLRHKLEIEQDNTIV